MSKAILDSYSSGNTIVTEYLEEFVVDSQATRFRGLLDGPLADADNVRLLEIWSTDPGIHQQVIDLYQTDLCILRLPGLRLRCGVYHPTIPPILRYSAHAYFPEGRPADAPIHIEALSGLVIGVTLLVGRVVSVTPTVERQTPVVPTAP